MGCMRSTRLQRLLQRGSQRARRASLALTSLMSASLDSAHGAQALGLGSSQLPNGAAGAALAPSGQAGSAAGQQRLEEEDEGEGSQSLGSAQPSQGIACALPAVLTRTGSLACSVMHATCLLAMLIEHCCL